MISESQILSLETSSNPLINSMLKNNKEDFEKYLSDGNFINMRDNNGITPLIASIVAEDSFYLDNIIKFDVSINQFDITGDNALIYAVSKNRLDIVRKLLQYEANPNFSEYTSSYALKIAIENQNLKIIDLLLLYAADVNLPDLKNEYPITHAIKSGNYQIVSKIIYRVDNIEQVDRYFQTPLFLSILSGNKNIAKLLFKNGAKLENIKLKGNSIFHYILFLNMPDMLHLVLKYIPYGSNLLNIENDSGETALYCAVQFENIKIIKSLIHHGANSNILNKSGKSILQIVVENENYDMLNYLLKLKLDPNMKSKNGLTPLLCAILKENIEMAKMLINNGAKLNCEDYFGNTPISFASYIGNTEMLDLLLFYEDDINRVSYAGKTALTEAIRAKNVNMLVHLIMNGASIDSIDINDFRDNKEIFIHLKLAYISDQILNLKKVSDYDIGLLELLNCSILESRAIFHLNHNHSSTTKNLVKYINENPKIQKLSSLKHIVEKYDQNFIQLENLKLILVRSMFDTSLKNTNLPDNVLLNIMDFGEDFSIFNYIKKHYNFHSLLEKIHPSEFVKFYSIIKHFNEGENFEILPPKIQDIFDSLFGIDFLEKLYDILEQDQPLSKLSGESDFYAEEWI